MKPAAEWVAQITEIIADAESAIRRDPEIIPELRLQVRLAAYLAYAHAARRACTALSSRKDIHLQPHVIEHLFACTQDWTEIIDTLLRLGKQIAYHINCCIFPDFR
jgi:hypothetical protein